MVNMANKYCIRAVVKHEGDIQSVAEMLAEEIGIPIKGALDIVRQQWEQQIRCYETRKVWLMFQPSYLFLPPSLLSTTVSPSWELWELKKDDYVSHFIGSHYGLFYLWLGWGEEKPFSDLQELAYWEWLFVNSLTEKELFEADNLLRTLLDLSFKAIYWLEEPEKARTLMNLVTHIASRGEEAVISFYRSYNKGLIVPVSNIKRLDIKKVMIATLECGYHPGIDAL